MMATSAEIRDSGEDSYNKVDISPDFKDPLGVKDPLSVTADDESDEFDFDYYLSQISPTVAKKLEVDTVPTTGNGSGSNRTVHHIAKLSVDNDIDTDEHDLFVHVDNPEKHTTTMETYITFRVTTKTTRSDFDSTEYQVRRRYNDFLWLRQRLEETQPTHIIPPLPEKHSWKRFDRFNQDFVKTRMIALQTFLQRIADHPVLSFNKNLYTFLTAKQWEFQAAKKEGVGMMTRWADSFHSMSAAYMVKNRHPEFNDIMTYIISFADKLAVTDRISQRVVKEEYDLLAELNEWGPIFTLWSNSEDKLSHALSAIAKSVEKCYLALQELIDTSEAHLTHPLKEYMLYTEAIKTVLRKRDAIQMEYDLLLEELSRKKEDRDQSKLTASNAQYPNVNTALNSEDIQKQIDEMTKQVESLNDKVTCANADLKADIDRWHKNKRKDFRKLFMNMADRQISYYQKCLEAWEEAIPKIQRTDLDVDELTQLSSKSVSKQ